MQMLGLDSLAFQKWLRFPVSGHLRVTQAYLHLSSRRGYSLPQPLPVVLRGGWVTDALVNTAGLDLILCW